MVQVVRKLDAHMDAMCRCEYIGGYCAIAAIQPVIYNQAKVFGTALYKNMEN
jgi:hypothetical protein